MSQTLEPPAPSRRRLLNWVIGATGLAWLASVAYPVLRFLSPLQTTGASGPFPVPPEKLAEVDGPQGFSILRAGGTRVLLLRDPDERLRALSAVCTHEGCTVQYLPGETIIWCACHNGKFSLDGRVISGPPPRPLPQYEVVRGPDGVNIKLGSA